MTGVWVEDSAWAVLDSAILAAIALNGDGSSTFGFSVYGPGAVTDVPYEDCNQITIQFDEDPDITTAASLQQVMKGVSVSAILTATGQQTVLGIPGALYDPALRVLQLDLSGRLSSAEQVSLSMSNLENTSGTVKLAEPAGRRL